MEPPLPKAPSTKTTTQTTTTAKLPVIIMPGYHPPALTDQFLASLPSFAQPTIIDALPTSPTAVHQWLHRHFPPTSQGDATPPIVAIGFSAGVVGLAGGLFLWQQQGGKIAQLIAIDGWGVPIFGMPVTRISHDYFTHLSTLPLGAGETNFYADPPIAHLQLWSQLKTTNGFAVNNSQPLSIDKTAIKTPMTAEAFVRRILHNAWNQSFNWHSTL